MKTLALLIFTLSACVSRDNQEQTSFPVLDISADDEWTTYEGKWRSSEGVIRFELSLKIGAFGKESNYKLIEYFDADSSASGTTSEGLYSTLDGVTGGEFRICLHELSAYDKGTFFRYKKSNGGDEQDEMFFITRGNDELLPCDNNFEPLTTDRRYSLHRRYGFFTVEGYFSMEQDSIMFFERNTREYWRVADLGEFTELSLAYNRLVKEKYEGIYLKALAYSIKDTTVTGKDALVIKRIERLGKEF